jgi:anti-sigma28 factor (negative regulator of flagellin synthesis)
MTTAVSSSLSSAGADRSTPATTSADSTAAFSGPTDTGAGQNRVELSDQAGAAKTMLAAAQQLASGETDPSLATIAQDIANGTYRPTSMAIAEALIRYERRLLQGS